MDRKLIEWIQKNLETNKKINILDSIDFNCTLNKSSWKDLFLNCLNPFNWKDFIYNYFIAEKKINFLDLIQYYPFASDIINKEMNKSSLDRLWSLIYDIIMKIYNRFEDFFYKSIGNDFIIPEKMIPEKITIEKITIENMTSENMTKNMTEVLENLSSYQESSINMNPLVLFLWFFVLFIMTFYPFKLLFNVIIGKKLKGKEKETPNVTVYHALLTSIVSVLIRLMGAFLIIVGFCILILGMLIATGVLSCLILWDHIIWIVLIGIFFIISAVTHIYLSISHFSEKDTPEEEDTSKKPSR